MAQSKWFSMKSAPKDGTSFLAWEVVICDELDEDDNIVARNQRHERPVIIQWMDMFGCFTEPRGHACPSNGSWTQWQPINPPPAIPDQTKE